MTAPLLRWAIALFVASLAMGLILIHAAYAGARPGSGGLGVQLPVDVSRQQ